MTEITHAVLMNALNDAKFYYIEISRIKNVFQINNANEDAFVILFLLIKFC